MATIAANIIDLAKAHQDLAYTLVFLLAMSEALPILGLFVPATAVIVGVSALVPVGAVSLWPLIACTSAGAIVGDGAAYWLGHRYHRELTERWPLVRYPELIARGDAFFHRYGGISVFIARFTPGVRSVVPLIAGILRMPVIQFYGMNVLSAVLWAPSHVLAGALIGASLAMVGAVAGRLAVFLVILVAILWIVAWVIRRAWRRLPALAMQAQERLWAWARARDTWMSRSILLLLDPAHAELPTLAILGVLLVGSLWLFLGILEDVISGDPLVRADAAVFQFLQTLRTEWGDQLMVAVTELGDQMVTAAVTVIALIWFGWHRAWRTAIYWSAAIGSAALFTVIVKATLHRPRPSDFYGGWEALSFPSGHAAVNAALYGFLVMLVAREVGPRWQPWIAVGGAAFVSSIAFSRLYLGVHWLSDVLAGLAFGVAWTILLTIAYRRRNPPPVNAGGLCAVVGAALLVIGGIYINQSHRTDLVRYASHEERRMMIASDWWQRGWADLPGWRVDLGGEFEEPLTFQWAGDLGELEKALLAKNWQVPVAWSWRSALAWLTPHTTLPDLPVLPRLQSGRLEALVMIRPLDNSDQQSRLVLHLWRSSVDLRDDSGVASGLWIGTVAMERVERPLTLVTLTRELPEVNAPRMALADAVVPRRLVHRPDVQSETTWDGLVLLGHGPPLQLVGD